MRGEKESRRGTAQNDYLLAPYADNYFEYDNQRRVTKEIAQGQGSSAVNPAGLGTYTFTYMAR